MMAYERVQVFAVVRIDKLIKDPLEQIAVQSVLPRFEDAQLEAVRLNSLVDHDRTEYVVRVTRYYPQGRSSTEQRT